MNIGHRKIIFNVGFVYACLQISFLVNQGVYWHYFLLEDIIDVPYILFLEFLSWIFIKLEWFVIEYIDLKTKIWDMKIVNLRYEDCKH